MVEKDEIFNLIEELTTTGENELDNIDMEKLKCLCVDHTTMTYAFNTIMTQLEKEHAQIRFSALLIINELFRSYHSFRQLLLKQLRRFFVLTIDSEHSMKTLLPINIAIKLKQKSLKLFHEWYKLFGCTYRRVDLGYDFLENVQRVEFGSVDVKTAEQSALETLHKEKEERVRRSKLQQVDMQMNDLFADVKSNVGQLEKCLAMFIPENELGTEIGSPEANSGKESGIISNTYMINICINKKHVIRKTQMNEDIIRSTRDLYKEITKQLVHVKRWLNVLTRCACKDAQKIENVLNVKNSMLNVCEKYAELDFHYYESSESENDDFVDVPDAFPVYENEVITDEQPCSSKAIHINRAEKTACRCPLPSGKLCLRMDLKRCPFHGLIVKRDDMGIAVDDNDKEADCKKMLEMESKKRQALQRDINLNLKGQLTKAKKQKIRDIHKARYARLQNIKDAKKTKKVKLEKKF